MGIIYGDFVNGVFLILLSTEFVGRIGEKSTKYGKIKEERPNIWGYPRIYPQYPQKMGIRIRTL